MKNAAHITRTQKYCQYYGTTQRDAISGFTKTAGN